jgi:copper homeostasis protein
MTDLEVCVCADDLTSLAQQLYAVKEAGGQRVELCADMAQDGLTPNLQAIEMARHILGGDLELLVMIRPRGGDFCYQAHEVISMLSDIELAARAGADGVVFGCVNAQGQLDLPVFEPLLRAAKSKGLNVTFHRAFDLLTHPQQVLSQLINLGLKRVLTSGTPWTSGKGAEQGIEQLFSYLQFAQGRIEVVVGGGVSLTNIAYLQARLIQSTSLSNMHQVLSFHCHSTLLTHNLIDAAKVVNAVSILNSKLKSQSDSGVK